MPARFSKNRIATSIAVAIISAALLTVYPFYPLQFTIILALVLGALALEVPSAAVLLAILLSVFAALYQDPFLGLTYLVVFVIVMALTDTWVEIGLVASSWILSFLVFPPLAIIATVLAGLHTGRQGALKVGLLSGISIFLLSWAQGLTQSGLMLVPFPASSRLVKPIPEPWQFTAFIPGAEILDPTGLAKFFGPLAPNLGDFRLYALIAAWSVTGYIIAFLSGRWKGFRYIAATILGLLPALVVSGLFAQTAPLSLAAAVVGGVVVTAAHMYITPLISAPEFGVFTSLEDLVPHGIPTKYSVLLGSPVCDERNIIVEQFLEASTKRKASCVLLTTDMGFAESAVSTLGDKLTVFVASPRATATSRKNIVPIPTGVQNLTLLNIELTKVVKDAVGTGARVCLDTLSDVLLAHKMLTTRKWVTDLLPRFENWELSVLGIFNPSLHSKEDIGGLLDLFKGYVEIFDKDVSGRTKKLIAVRKMTDLQYNENELILDRQQLMRQRERKGGILGRLSR